MRGGLFFWFKLAKKLVMNLETNKIYLGDSLEVLKQLPDNSVDSCVCDPPYGIKFMNRKWDYNIPSIELWQEVLRVLKPGAHALVACGNRTQHRMAINLEDAGFEIRDIICWHYGEGFPKNHNIGKAVDKLQGNEREVLGEEFNFGKSKLNDGKLAYGDYAGSWEVTTGSSPYEGWGTALKPATEFFTLVRKPLSEKSIAKNVLKWGTGAINIDDCRVGNGRERVKKQGKETGNNQIPNRNYNLKDTPLDLGRFPANLIHDGSDEVEEQFAKAGVSKSERKKVNNKGSIWGSGSGQTEIRVSSDFGTPSRFFYCAKASKSERGASNNHPTVKPLKLMSYLCRLITPPNGVCLDPFLGSGTTAIACIDEGFDYIGIEKEPEYHVIALERIAKQIKNKRE